MSNKEQILNLIKEELNADESLIAWHYAGTVPCHKCPFKEECRKDKESVGPSKCAVILHNKLQEDKEKMEDKEVKEDKEEALNEEKKVSELEFEKELLLRLVIKLTGNNPQYCY